MGRPSLPSLVGVGEHELCWLVARAERQLALGLIDRPSLCRLAASMSPPHREAASTQQQAAAAAKERKSEVALCRKHLKSFGIFAPHERRVYRIHSIPRTLSTITPDSRDPIQNPGPQYFYPLQHCPPSLPSVPPNSLSSSATSHPRSFPSISSPPPAPKPYPPTHRWPPRRRPPPRPRRRTAPHRASVSRASPPWARTWP